MRRKNCGNKEILAAALLVAGLVWLAEGVQAEESGQKAESVQSAETTQGNVAGRKMQSCWSVDCSGENAKENIQAEIAEKILRFHVRANSDSERDQQVKEEVRDAVGSYIEPKLTDAGTLEETKAIVEENMDGIMETAERVLKQEGEDYTVNAFLTRTLFPVKTYGNYTFPAGEYEALEVVLGEGKGHNWWCVLYPNMCFRGSVYEIVAEEAEEALREVLTVEEYQEVFDSGKFEIRWKFLEYFK